MSLTSTTVPRIEENFNPLVVSSRLTSIETESDSQSSALSKEFSVASAISKTIKESLTPDMSNICESYLSTKLTAKFRGLAKYADGRSGFRSFYLSKFGKKLKGFDFNTAAPYRKVFKAKYHVKSGSRKGQVILHFPSFIPANETKAPKEATNFKISARLVAVSDFSFDKSQNIYHQLNKEYHGKYASYEGAMLPILKIPLDPTTTQLSVDQKEIPEDISVFLLMSISFYTYSQGKFNLLDKESSLYLEQVF